jgi:hypothetical protein
VVRAPRLLVSEDSADKDDGDANNEMTKKLMDKK